MTFLDRINRFYVLGVGVLVAGVVVLVAFMTMVRPAVVDYKAKQQAAAQQETIAARKPTAVTALKKANDDLAAVKAAYQVVKTERNPEIQMLPDMDLTLFNYLWPELRGPSGAGPTLRTWFQEQGWQFTGIESIANPGTTAIAADTNAIAIPLGTMTMQIRDFPEVLRFLPHLKETPRITAMGDEITIKGPSPNLSIDFPLTLYILTGLPPTGGGAKPAKPATPAPGPEQHPGMTTPAGGAQGGKAPGPEDHPGMGGKPGSSGSGVGN